MTWIAAQPGQGDEVYEGNDAAALIDDELWPRLVADLRSASARVEISQLLFEREFVPMERPLVDELEAAAARGVRVRILVNENAVIPDSYDELRERFEGTRVEVERLTMTPNVLHAKLFLVDERVGYLVDSPFEQQYRDTRSHTFTGGTRGEKHALHAVSLRLEGPAVARLVDIYESLWRSARAEPLRPLPPRPRDAPAKGRQTLQTLWTAPQALLSEREDDGILRAYLRAIENAERFIYVENQYFTNATVADALARALDAKPGLEAILLLNPHMDVPSYDAWERRRLREMDAFRHPRLGVFALWTPRRVRRDPALRAVYIHAKVAIVDDCWATIGSANLDSASLETADEFFVPVERNVEVNAVLLDGVDGAPATGFVADLRRRLWSEHLGDEGVWRAQAPEGWLAHWRAIAQENARRFAQGSDGVLGRVLPFEALADDELPRFQREA